MNAWCILCDIFNMCQLIKSNSIQCDDSSPDHTHAQPFCEQDRAWQAFAGVSSNMLTLIHSHQDSEKLSSQIGILRWEHISTAPVQSLWRFDCTFFSGEKETAGTLILWNTYPVVPAWSLLPQRWFSQGQPRTSHPVRRCLPGPCRSVRPTPLEPYRSQSHRWRRSAAWSDHRPPHLHSSCSDQSLPPTGWTERFIKKK